METQNLREEIKNGKKYNIQGRGVQRNKQLKLIAIVA